MPYKRPQDRASAQRRYRARKAGRPVSEAAPAAPDAPLPLTFPYVLYSDPPLGPGARAPRRGH